MSSLLSHKSIRVKKNTHGTAPSKDGTVSPVAVLVDRNQQWKHITKSLLAYYQGLSAIESTTAKATTALMDTIQVPFHEGNAFLGDGGWQEVLYEVRDKSKIIADHHSALASTLDDTVVKELQGIRADLKAHIAAIEKEAGVLETELNKERAASSHALSLLQSGIDTFENSSEHMLPQHDPYITRTQATTQLTKQVLKENDFQAALIRFQQQQPSFEAGIAKSIQSACTLYDKAKKTKMADIETVQDQISVALQRVSPSAEYEFFSSKPDAVLDPNTPFRSLEALKYPGQDHVSTVPIKEGILERKKRFTKSYKEAYYVLSPSGFLHERKSNDDTNAIVPKFSLFLPECSLGAPAKPTDKSHKFHVEGNKAVRSVTEGKMKRSLRFGGKEIAYSFRARTDAEMKAWWTEMDKLSRDTQPEVPVQTVKKTPVDPIGAAVANVGYAQPVDESQSHDEVHESHEVHETETPVVVHHEHVDHEHESGLNGTHEHEHEEVDSDEDEEGGSSAEEEEEYETTTAPTTPAVGGMATSPLDVHEEKAQSPAEVLPTYLGIGTAAEHEALTTEKKGGMFSSIFGSSSSSSTPAPAASTSTSG